MCLTDVEVSPELPPSVPTEGGGSCAVLTSVLSLVRGMLDQTNEGIENKKFRIDRMKMTEQRHS